MPTFTRRAAIAALFFGSLALAAPHTASADETDAAKALVTSTAERLVALIRADQPIEQKRVAFRDLMNETAAMPQIARYALGRPWRKMSDEQKAEYLDLFPAYLSKIYTKRFNDYAGETLEVVGAEARGDKGVFVNTQVVRAGAEPLEVIWRVQDKAGSPQITDINIEGISLLITQREDFQGQLQQSNGDVAAFLDRLRSLAS
ncbi:MAG: ABC transporter substrate-binding protein [Pseudomonadota bacterium]